MVVLHGRKRMEKMALEVSSSPTESQKRDRVPDTQCFRRQLIYRRAICALP